jgi:hypothetical protein
VLCAVEQKDALGLSTKQDSNLIEVNLKRKT